MSSAPTPSSTSQSPDQPAPVYRLVARRAARVAIAGAGTFAAASLLAGALNPGYSHRSDTISALAAHDAQVPVVMTIGFLGLAAGLVAAGAGLLSSLKGKLALAGALLVMVAGAATVAAAFARLDCSALTSASCVAREHAETVSAGHVLHNLVSLGLFLALVIGLFLLAGALRRTPHARSLARPTRYAALAALALIVWFGSGAFGDNGGLVQRAFVLVLVGWPVYLVAALTKRASSTRAHD